MNRGKQQEEKRQSYGSIVCSHAPQQDFPNFVNLPDSAESSEILGSLNYLEGERVQLIQQSRQFRQSPPDQPYGVAAVGEGLLSSSQRGALNQLLHPLLHLQHQFEQEVIVLNPTTIPGELNQVEQQTEQLEWAKRFQQPQRTMYAWVMVVFMQDQKDQSNILLHDLKCAKIDRMHIYKLKTDCNGETDCK